MCVAVLVGAVLVFKANEVAVCSAVALEKVCFQKPREVDFECDSHAILSNSSATRLSIWDSMSFTRWRNCVSISIKSLARV